MKGVLDGRLMPALPVASPLALEGCTAPPVAAPTPQVAPSPTVRPVAGGAAATSLRWIGHGSFLLTTAQGTRILMDPIPPGYGFSGPPLEGVDAITVSHEHPDHVNLSVAAGSPLVLRGLSGGDWVQLERQVKEVAIRTVGLYHDDTQGSQRGKVSAFVFTADGLHIVHLGDLGHVLTPEQVAALGPVDVLLIPVGGFYTNDGVQATEVMGQLSPRVVIPMHYKTPKLGPDWPGVGVEDFLVGKTVQRPGSTTYTFSGNTLPRETTVVVLEYE